jgi:hypothetical protein
MVHRETLFFFCRSNVVAIFLEAAPSYEIPKVSDWETAWRRHK